MSLQYKLEVANVSDIGCNRSSNEDSTASNEELGILLLADGMGGHNSGDVASTIAVSSIYHKLEKGLKKFSDANAELSKKKDVSLVVEAINEANACIYRTGKENSKCSGMGTTIIATLIQGNNVIVGHVGDSRLYRMRDDKFTQLTEDHSLVQELVNRGIFSYEESMKRVPKNIITKALGLKDTVDVAIVTSDLHIGDLYLLCSDGLTDIIKDEEIHLTLKDYSDSLTQTADQLVDLVIHRGGNDNISVILAKALSH